MIKIKDRIKVWLDFEGGQFFNYDLKPMRFPEADLIKGLPSEILEPLGGDYSTVYDVLSNIIYLDVAKHPIGRVYVLI